MKRAAFPVLASSAKNNAPRPAPRVRSALPPVASNQRPKAGAVRAVTSRASVKASEVKLRGQW